MKKVIFTAVFCLICGIAKAGTPVDVIDSTATLAIVSVSSSAATTMDTTIPSDRAVIAIQNQDDTYSIKCGFKASEVTAGRGWIIPALGNWILQIRPTDHNDYSALHLYCITLKTTGATSAAVVQAGAL